MSRSAEPTYSTLEVSRLTGATLRQLQWWQEKGYCPGVTVARRVRCCPTADTRRALVYVRIWHMHCGFTALWEMSRQADRIFGCRFLLLAKNRLVAATDDPAEVIRIGEASNSAVILIDMKEAVK